MASTDKVYTRVYDDFTAPTLASDKWALFDIGGYKGDDGVVTTGPTGLQVTATGTNPTTGEPMFTTTTGSDIEHIKWLVSATAMSSAGLPGFDTHPGHVLSLHANAFSGETYGTARHPFGDLIEPHHPALGTALFLCPDYMTGLIFGFFLTNSHVYVVYERLPQGRTAQNNFASFTYAIPVATRSASDVHNVKVSYDKSAKTVRWYLESDEVFSVTRIGHYLADATHLCVDRGGIPADAGDLLQLGCGVGLLTLLDTYSQAKGQALVKLNSAPGFYVNPATHAGEVDFWDEGDSESSRLFGQGARVCVGEVVVSSESK